MSASIAYSDDFLADLRRDSLIPDAYRVLFHTPLESVSRCPLRSESNQEHLSLLLQRLRQCPVWIMQYALLTLEGYDNEDCALFMGLSLWALESRIQEYREGHIRVQREASHV